VHKPALSFVFFVSGVAALIFEIVWFYRCGLVFGNSIWAASLVLSSFMGGLALGNGLVAWFGTRIERPLRAYAALEATVGVAGLLLTYALPPLTTRLAPFTSAFADKLWMVNAVRLGGAFALLCGPSTAMGATLPVLVGALCRYEPGIGAALGRLYGWNTLGAVVGVIAAETALIGRVGVAGAAWTAAALDLGAAAMAWLLAARVERPERIDPFAPGAGVMAAPPAQVEARRRVRAAESRRQVSARPQAEKSPAGATVPGPRRLLACAMLGGADLLALEVVWFRFLSLYAITTTLVVSVMLATVLGAIALGGLCAASWVRRRPGAVRYPPAIALLAGTAVIASYIAFQSVTEGTQVVRWSRILWFALVLTGATSLLSGVLFTLLGEALGRSICSEAAAAGWLTLANTVGAAIGPPLAAFVLLPAIGMERTFFVLALLYGLVAGLWAFQWEGGMTPLRSPTFILAVAVFGVAVGRFPFGLMNGEYFVRAAAAYNHDGSEIVATREGPDQTIFVMQQKWLGQPVYSRLVTNGFSMSGTTTAGQRYMRYFVYWPMILHRAPLRRVLIVCYGAGVTASAATDLPSAESIDIVEISRDMVATSDVIYPADRHPLHDPRVRLHLEDGRYFLQTKDEGFDLITGEPPPPRLPGAVNIYTREYFRLIRDRLAEGGMATYWLPVARPDPGTDVNTIIRGFCEVFDDCSLWNGTPFDLMLVGTRHADGPVSAAEFTSPWSDPALAARLREVGFEAPEQIGATFIGDAAYLRQLAAGAPPLTDDFPQRLRPVPARPSISDPDVRANSAAAELFRQVIDPARARDGFVRSDYIRRLWPPALARGTTAFFAPQVVMNRVLIEGGRPLRQIEDLHFLLTKTSLRTLPLWVLGTDDVHLRIADQATEETQEADYARGARALAARDYIGAAAFFAKSDRPLLVYALCLGGEIDAARRLARIIQPGDADERHFWQWMEATFSVTAPGLH
jgi:predicted membrane-bound spermidine synthase